jgi:hypothetical protein
MTATGSTPFGEAVAEAPSPPEPCVGCGEVLSLDANASWSEVLPGLGGGRRPEGPSRIASNKVISPTFGTSTLKSRYQESGQTYNRQIGDQNNFTDGVCVSPDLGGKKAAQKLKRREKERGVSKMRKQTWRRRNIGWMDAVLAISLRSTSRRGRQFLEAAVILRRGMRRLLAVLCGL